MIAVPTGYHLAGTIPSTWPSTLLRPYRGSATRNEFYKDCYYVESSKLWKCCISGCSETDVVMFCRPNSTHPEFQNFYSHISNHHAHMLSGEDFINNKKKAEAKKGLSPSAKMTITTFLAPSASSTTQSPINATNIFKETVTSKNEKINTKKKQLAQIFAKLIAHGGFTFSMLSNDAVRELLIDLKVVPPDCNFFPGPTCVTKYVDEFVTAEDTAFIALMKMHLSKASGGLRRASFGFDCWESKQKKHYLGLTIHFVLSDWEGVFSSPIRCAPFPLPHNMENIRNVLISRLSSILDICSEDAILMIQSLTYDGAKNNEAFNPSPTATGLTSNERALRREVQDRFKHVEEATCICHRLAKMEEHVIYDDNSATSVSFLEHIQSVYEVADKVKTSANNRQELERVQKGDENRIGRVVQDLNAPKTRWSYNDGRLHRILFRLWKYYPQMSLENTNIASSADKREWNAMLTAGEESVEVLKIVTPIFRRISRWLLIFQTRGTITQSLILKCADDLISFADRIGDASDEEGNQICEAIASRFKAQMVCEFEKDFENDYLKLLQLFDPRVSYRSGKLHKKFTESFLLTFF
jgi:hypothetical protein